MTLPSSIKVGPYTFSISGDARKIKDVKVSSDDAARVGQTGFHTLEIIVDQDLAPDMLRSTLQHEVLHACALAAGLQADTLDVEDWINRLGPFYLLVLRENPSYVAFLLDGVPEMEYLSVFHPGLPNAPNVARDYEVECEAFKVDGLDKKVGSQRSDGERRT